MAPLSKTIVGQSGRLYSLERVLQEQESIQRYVYLATSGNDKFILKNVSKYTFVYYQDMYRSLRSCPHLRVSCDIIPEQSMFVYKYLSDYLLSLAQEDLPLTLVKRILKDALRGLAALHDRDIVHTDIKANNILIHRNDPKSIVIDQVQLADLEDSAILPPGKVICGKQAGNYMWRSPEAHASGPMDKPSDMFSFGIVCFYAVHRRLLFFVGEDELGEGEEVLAHVIERQISYFADEKGLDALLKHLGDNPWIPIFRIIAGGFNKENPRRPAYLWKDIDADLRHLVCGLTNFDPSKRLTAHEALEHQWFKDV